MAVLSGVAITGSSGTFSCNATTLTINQMIIVSGTNTGTGSIAGQQSYLPAPTFITATNGSTTFTLSSDLQGTALATTAGTTTGLTFSTVAGLGQIYAVTCNGNGNYTQSTFNPTLQFGQPVVISGNNQGAAISGYTDPILCYVVGSPSGNNFSLSLTKGGPTLLGNSGSTTGLTFTYFPVTAQGSLSVNDYNNMQAVLNGVLGTGLGGYGQAVSSSQQAQGTQVTSTEWNNLRTDIIQCNNHQSATSQSLIARSKGNKISITEVAQYASLLYTIYKNRYQLSSGYYSLSGLAGTAQSGNTWGRNGVNETLEFTYTVTWANANNIHYFFNSGGYISFSASESGSWGTTTKDYSWQNALNKLGEIRVNATTNYQSGGQTAGTSTSLGYYNLTTTQQLLFSFNTATYTPNDVKLYAALSGSNAIIFKYVLEDQSGQPNPPYGTDELVQGTITSTTSYFYATGTGQVTAPLTSSATVVASVLPNLGP